MFNKQNAASVLDIPDLVELLTAAVYEEKGHRERVHSACDRMEDFLGKAGTEMREMVAIEMSDNIGYPFGSDAFAQFSGPELKRHSKRSGKDPSCWICRIGRSWKGKY